MKESSRKLGRRIIVVDLWMQVGIGLVLALALALGWLVGTTFLVTELRDVQVAGISAPAHAELLDAVGALLKASALLGAGVALAIWVIASVAAHRIAGPLYALLVQLTALAKGQLPRARKLRPFDFFPGLALMLQEVTNTLRAREREEIAKLDQVALMLDQGRPEQAAEELRRLRESKHEMIAGERPLTPPEAAPDFGNKAIASGEAR